MHVAPHKSNSRFNLLLRVALLSLSIIGISLLHYLTPLHLPILHDIFQLLYYISIIFAAFWFGMRGAVVTSIIVSIMYAPHVLFQWGVHPTMEMEKYLEIVLYNVVGGITGYLSQKEEERRQQLQRTALGLEESYKKLQSQTDLIIGIKEQLRRGRGRDFASDCRYECAFRFRVESYRSNPKNLDQKLET